MDPKTKRKIIIVIGVLLILAGIAFGIYNGWEAVNNTGM